jgi:DNA-binding NarL/FixJ family response regulator
MSKMRILVADDHEVVRRGIRTLIGEHSEWLICGEASTGQDTVAKTARLKPDVVILDITMPGLGGLEAIPEIFKARPGTKILVLTMHDSGPTASRALGAGATGLVLKSDAGRDLIRALQALGRNQSFLSSAMTDVLANELRRAPEAAPPPSTLTARETEVCKLLAEGKSSKEVSAALGISPRTVDAHRASIMHKLNLRTLSELIGFAIRNKMVEI